MQQAQVRVLTAGVRAPMTPMRDLEHDPEKWKPVFRKDHAQTKN